MIHPSFAPSFPSASMEQKLQSIVACSRDKHQNERDIDQILSRSLKLTQAVFGEDTQEILLARAQLNYELSKKLKRYPSEDETLVKLFKLALKFYMIPAKAGRLPDVILRKDRSTEKPAPHRRLIADSQAWSLPSAVNSSLQYRLIVGSQVGEGTYNKISSAYYEKGKAAFRQLKSLSSRVEGKWLAEIETHFALQKEIDGLIEILDIFAINKQISLEGEESISKALLRAVLMPFVPKSLNLLQETASANDRFSIALQISESLTKLHALGYIHGDLKLANILYNYCEIEKKYHVYIADLGAVQSIGSPQKKLCTYQSCAPEALLLGKSLEDLKEEDPALDVWSLGIILYELSGESREVLNQLAILTDFIKTGFYLDFQKKFFDVLFDYANSETPLKKETKDALCAWGVHSQLLYYWKSLGLLQKNHSIHYDIKTMKAKRMNNYHIHNALINNYVIIHYPSFIREIKKKFQASSHLCDEAMLGALQIDVKKRWTMKRIFEHLQDGKEKIS